MIDHEHYEDLVFKNYGEECLTYLRNKNRGGKNNEKGTTYEDYFTLFYISNLYETLKEYQNQIYLIPQARCFVDDLVVNHKYSDLIEHFQIKNVMDLSWGKGPKSIADDYLKEYKLGTGFSLKLDLNLVVSSKELEEKMLKTMPPEISGFTNIHCFHHGETLSRCLFSNKGFLDSVKHLCAFDDQIDKVETVAAVLLGAWKSIEKSSITVSDIIEKAKNHRPSFIRALSENYQPDSRLLKILDNIENFNYDIQKGFMRWTYRDGLERGVFPYDCESENFKKFQGYIIEKNPLKFEDIEQMLLFNPEGF